MLVDLFMSNLCLFSRSARIQLTLNNMSLNCMSPLICGFFPINKVTVFSFLQIFKCGEKFVFAYRSQYVPLPLE